MEATVVVNVIQHICCQFLTMFPSSTHLLIDSERVGVKGVIKYVAQYDEIQKEQKDCNVFERCKVRQMHC